MKKSLVSVFLTISVLIMPQSAHAFTDGQYLAESSRAFERWSLDQEKNTHDATRAMFFMAYVSASMDMMRAFNMICINTGETTQGQVASIVAKYIRNTPESWSKEAVVVVAQALRPAFPCRKD